MFHCPHNLFLFKPRTLLNSMPWTASVLLTHIHWCAAWLSAPCHWLYGAHWFVGCGPCTCHCVSLYFTASYVIVINSISIVVTFISLTYCRCLPHFTCSVWVFCWPLLHAFHIVSSSLSNTKILRLVAWTQVGSCAHGLFGCGGWYEILHTSWISKELCMLPFASNRLVHRERSFEATDKVVPLCFHF